MQAASAVMGPQGWIKPILFAAKVVVGAVTKAQLAAVRARGQGIV